ncbi:hypothetical protein OF83DRAFT_1176987 [Amylostereum chailletii]|nr:hypothetical protein OF83DRAFT_1176987 [Amylostereum chailletii]
MTSRYFSPSTPLSQSFSAGGVTLSCGYPDEQTSHLTRTPNASATAQEPEFPTVRVDELPKNEQLVLFSRILASDPLSLPRLFDVFGIGHWSERERWEVFCLTLTSPYFNTSLQEFCDVFGFKLLPDCVPRPTPQALLPGLPVPIVPPLRQQTLPPPPTLASSLAILPVVLQPAGFLQDVPISTSIQPHDLDDVNTAFLNKALLGIKHVVFVYRYSGLSFSFPCEWDGGCGQNIEGMAGHRKRSGALGQVFSAAIKKHLQSVHSCLINDTRAVCRWTRCSDPEKDRLQVAEHVAFVHARAEAMTCILCRHTWLRAFVKDKHIIHMQRCLLRKEVRVPDIIMDELKKAGIRIVRDKDGVKAFRREI